MDSNDLAWAAFRTALISPLLTGEIQSGQREAYMQSIAAQERIFPNGKRAKVSVRTLWRWYHRMRKDGFQGILKQPRSDRGKPRRAIQARVNRAVELKREQPFRSDRVINEILKAELGTGLPSATVYRHLRIQGATRRQLVWPKRKSGADGLENCQTHYGREISNMVQPFSMLKRLVKHACPLGSIRTVDTSSPHVITSMKTQAA